MLVEGTDGPDNLVGTDIDDTFYGKKGDDTMFGLGGADLFVYTAGHNVSDGDGSDIIDGGTGSDIFQVYGDYLRQSHGSNSGVGFVNYSLTAGANGSALFTSSQDWIVFDPSSGGTYQSTVTLKAVENFGFTGTLNQPPPPDIGVLYTTADHLTVGDLSSTALNGQIYFDGGSGNDVLDAHAASNQILAYGGTGDDTLIGGLGSNTLYGQDGNDTLQGLGTSNTLVGGTGDDVYYVRGPADTVVEAANEGNDAVITAAPIYTLGANLENLYHSGASDFTGVGNAGNNWIQGGAGSDYLIGLGGNDYLYGGPGAANALQGGTGDDTYIIENPGDSPIEFANEGHDTVLTTLSTYTLLTNFEDLRYSGTSAFTGTGNAADNSIQGSSGNDHLIGLGGNDTLDGGGGSNILEGGTGDDLYIVRNAGDTVIELAGEGHDTVQTTLASYTLAANVEDLTIQTGGGSFNGNAADNVIRVLGAASYVDGGAGNDTITGGAGNDVLSGGSGNDVLIGGAGGDELTGGSGADHFVFTAGNNGQDLIHDFSRAEGDKIDVSALLSSLGPVGADPFADGVLTFEPIAAFGSSGTPATRVLIDIDGSAGAAAPTTLFVALGSTSAVDHNDFIIV